jgi:hypothetical protein
MKKQIIQDRLDPIKIDDNSWCYAEGNRITIFGRSMRDKSDTAMIVITRKHLKKILLPVGK